MNIQSIRNKLDDIQGCVIRNNCDILLLSETWLCETEISFYQLNGYDALHCCRDKRGGGVSIFVKKGIKYNELAKSPPEENYNWICAQIGENNLKISVVYKPPSYDNNQFLLHLENIMTKFSKSHTIIGDFNINLLEDDKYLTNNYQNVIKQNNFSIVNKINTESATRVTPNCHSIIDHVLISDNNIKNILNRAINIDENPLSDHRRILITLIEKVQIYKPKTLYEVKSINHNKFKDIFSSQVGDNNVINSFQHLITTIQQCKTQCEYTKVIKVKEGNTWITGELLSLMSERDKLYKEICKKKI